MTSRGPGHPSARAPVRRERIPRLSGLGKLDFVRRLLVDPVAAFAWLHATHGPSVALRLPGYNVISITDLDDVRRVMKDNHQNYSKGSQYTDMEPLWGTDNLLSSHGQSWTRQRRVCGPEFRPARGAAYQATIVRHTEALLDSYEPIARAGQTRRLYDDMKDLILHILCDEWFGASPRDAVQRTGRLLREITDIASGRVLMPVNLPLWLPTPRHRRYQRLLRELRALILDMIRAREGAAEDRLDLLGRMLRARADSAMSDDDVYNNIVVFLLAAYETPSIGWTLYFIGKHPEVAAKLRAEVQTVLAGRAPDIDDLARLRYVGMCIDESMRLFAVSPILAREALADDELATCRVQAAVTVTIPASVIHHDPAHWPEPERYWPERFADRASLHPFSFMPFGQGPRACIGGALARQIMTTILAMLFQRYTYSLEPGYHARPRDKLKPHPLGSVPASLRRLAGNESLA